MTPIHCGDEHHRLAALHHEQAARLHRRASRHYKKKEHAQAARHSLAAIGHTRHAIRHANNAGTFDIERQVNELLARSAPDTAPQSPSPSLAIGMVEWPIDDRARWLPALAMAIGIIYGPDDGGPGRAPVAEG